MTHYAGWRSPGVNWTFQHPAERLRPLCSSYKLPNCAQRWGEAACCPDPAPHPRNDGPVCLRRRPGVAVCWANPAPQDQRTLRLPPGQGDLQLLPETTALWAAWVKDQRGWLHQQRSRLQGGKLPSALFSRSVNWYLVKWACISTFPTFKKLKAWKKIP